MLNALLALLQDGDLVSSGWTGTCWRRLEMLRGWITSAVGRVGRIGGVSPEEETPETPQSPFWHLKGLQESWSKDKGWRARIQGMASHGHRAG